MLWVSGCCRQWQAIFPGRFSERHAHRSERHKRIADCNSNTDFFTHRDSIANAHRDCHTNGDVHAYHYAYGNAHGHPNSYTDSVSRAAVKYFHPHGGACW